MGREIWGGKGREGEVGERCGEGEGEVGGRCGEGEVARER